MRVTKRDGTIVPFEVDKITESIWKAVCSVGGTDHDQARQLASDVERALHDRELELADVEVIQDQVEKTLIEAGKARTAKAYILYRQHRTDVRELKSAENKIIAELVFADAIDVDDKRENANVNADATINNTCGFTK